MSYIQISRTELEKLRKSDSLPFDWERVEGKEGIYHINCSDMVAIKLSSTQTQHDEAMGKGHASMNLSLVSKLNGWALNKKARDQRSTSSEQTIGRRLGLMGYSIGFQNTVQRLRLTKIADRESYKAKWLAIIGSSPNIAFNPVLKAFYERGLRGWDFMGE